MTNEIKDSNNKNIALYACIEERETVYINIISEKPKDISHALRAIRDCVLSTEKYQHYAIVCTSYKKPLKVLPEGLRAISYKTFIANDADKLAALKALANDSDSDK